jgi:hypothetical protein
LDKSKFPEQTQVVRHSRLGLPNRCGEITDAELMGGKSGYDPQTSRIPKRGEELSEPQQCTWARQVPARGSHRVDMDDAVVTQIIYDFSQLINFPRSGHC